MSKRITRRRYEAFLRELLDHQDLDGHIMGPENAAYLHELERSPDKCELLRFLAAKEYISTDSTFDGLDEITIQKAGQTYFSDGREKRNEDRKTFRRDLYAAMISAALGAILSRPTWDGIDQIVELMRRWLP